MAEVWIVTGTPGAGKTTISSLLASRYDPSVRIRGDRLADMIVNGQIDPDDERVDESEDQIKLLERSMCRLARSFSQSGFMSVIDWVVRNKQDLGVYVRNLAGCALYFVVLTPKLEVVARRKPDAFRRWAHLAPEIEQDFLGIGLRVDSSYLSPDATVDYIWRRKESARITGIVPDRGVELDAAKHLGSTGDSLPLSVTSAVSSDRITIEEFSTGLGELCVKSALNGIPRRFRDQHILMKSVVLRVGTGKDHTEADINDSLRKWFVDVGSNIEFDHVSLRRWLVDERYLERNSNGSRYRVATSGPALALFDDDIDNLDVAEVIREYKESLELKKRQFLR